jgi:methyl-accepting chemotaxis protein
LADLRGSAAEIERALSAATAAVAEVAEAATGSVDHARDSMDRMQAASADSQPRGRMGRRARAPHRRDRGPGSKAVERSTARIGDIASEVGILAINARIVAARAGRARQGFRGRGRSDQRTGRSRRRK